MFLASLYYSHSFLKTVHSCFLYTTQGNAEDAELQESVYTNDTQGCYIAGMRLYGKISSHLLIHWLELYQVQIIWIPIMKLNWLIWYKTNSCHYLFEWKAQDSSLHHHLLLYCFKLPIELVHRSTAISLSHVHQYKYRQHIFCALGSLFAQKNKNKLCCFVKPWYFDW